MIIYLPATNMLTHAYKSNLLASLVKKEYEKPVDTFEELFNSGVKVAMPGGTSVPYLMRDSPRKIVRDVYNERAYEIEYVLFRVVYSKGLFYVFLYLFKASTMTLQSFGKRLRRAWSLVPSPSCSGTRSWQGRATCIALAATPSTPQ